MLIEGIRQRLLAFLVRSIQSGAPSEVCSTMQDFHFSFGHLCKLVVWRAQLLDRSRLLLKLGQPAAPAAFASAGMPGTAGNS